MNDGRFSTSTSDNKNAQNGTLKFVEYPAGDATPHAVAEWYKTVIRTMDLYQLGALIDNKDLPSWPREKSLDRAATS